ncbi:MAG TPA: glycosyltransferase [Marmoricola sp.]|nr:glycosyltransferase [Marmoricola sp.]
MKIRFLLHNVYAKGGGVVTVTLALAEELAVRHDVELVSVFGEPPAIHELPDGVKVAPLVARWDRRVPRMLRSWLADRPSRLVPPTESRFTDYSAWSDLVLRLYLRSLRDGVVVTMQPALNIAAARVAPRQCLLVAQDHRPYRSRDAGIRGAYQQHAGRLDALLTLTRADARKYRSLLGDQVLVQAVPNGTPPYEGARSTCENQVVVAAGRLSRSKGFDVLVDAWAEVAKSHPDWCLQIWGEGHLEDELSRQIEKSGLSRQVRLMGWSPSLQAEMAEASVFVLSSRAEGYPRVILEAMACGLPVVSTDCPSGPREMITSGVDGVLVPNQDPQALAAALSDMIRSGPEARRALGAAGLERVEVLDQREVARRWERLLRRVQRRRSSKERKNR